jgi:hypothetical protein
VYWTTSSRSSFGCSLLVGLSRLFMPFFAYIQGRRLRHTVKLAGRGEEGHAAVQEVMLVHNAPRESGTVCTYQECNVEK